jgi:hypothetical protein
MRVQLASGLALKATFSEYQPEQMVVTKLEQCQNPWNGSCNSENINLYIMVKGEKLPICRQCWTSIADKDVEW